MSEQVLAQLSDAGVALWLDDISRDRLATGNLEALIRDKHIVGYLDPTIFQKAIAVRAVRPAGPRLGLAPRDRRGSLAHDHSGRHPVGL